jgi:hypothetical protein
MIADDRSGSRIPVAAAAQVVRVALRPLGASALRRAICDRLIPDALSRGARSTP